MRLRHIYLFGVGILTLLIGSWGMYLSALYASAMVQIDISEPTRKSTTNGLRNQMANKTAPTAKSFSSTLVSYVYGGSVLNATYEARLLLTGMTHGPGNMTHAPGNNTVDMCEDNLDVFLKRGYSPNLDIDFVFTVLQGRQVPNKLQELALASTNVFIHKATWDCGVDLCQHQSVVDKRRGMKNYSEFIFVNCGSRGPYGFAQGPGQSIGSIWYQHVRRMLTAYDAIGPTISAEFEYHLQTYMIAVSSRSIHIIDTIWARAKVSKELVLMKFRQLNMSVKHMGVVGHFLKLQSANYDRQKHFRIALGEFGLSFALLSHGKKLHAMCFDARTLGVAPGEEQGKNPTCCLNEKAAPACKDPNVTHISVADCLICPPLDPNQCLFVKFGGEIVRSDLLSPWTYARISEYDLRDLGYRLQLMKYVKPSRRPSRRKRKR